MFQHARIAAERHAKLPKLDGGAWHALRRKWASERKQLPLVDVAAAGGWKDTQRLVECYQHADRDTMLAVMSAEKGLRPGDGYVESVQTGTQTGIAFPERETA